MEPYSLEFLSRRRFLRQGSLACAGLFPRWRVSGRALAQAPGLSCNSQLRTPGALHGHLSCGLPPVRVRGDRVLRTVVGLRPYRPSGFIVRPEKVDDTLVIHNYGHGGAGITLSWGTAQLALQAGCQGFAGPVAVLGCGAVGLATARLLQEAGFDVTIYTKELPPDTTSNVAGAAWSPFLVADPERIEPGFQQQLLFAALYAHKRFVGMLSANAPGVRWIRSYSVGRARLGHSGAMEAQSLFRSIRPEFREMTAAEHPFPVGNSVRQSDTLLIEPPRYLGALIDAFRQASGKVVVGNIADRLSIARLPERLVFNCTGMGAKDLFHDAELTPARGQLTFLKPQPEVDYAVSHDDLYMLPRTDGIVLGGTYELGVSSLMPDVDKMRKILTRHSAFFDSYRHTACPNARTA